MCTASVSPHHVLLAFQQGVDGIFVSGCKQGECHYLYGNVSALKRMNVLRPLLSFCGIEAERLHTRWLSSAEAPEFAEEIREFVEEIKKLGPSPLAKPFDPAKNALSEKQAA